MESAIFGQEFLNELVAEAGATRKCLERIPETLYDWKPHEKSMNMGYLVLLVAEIPKWITYIIEASEIDLATFPHFQLKKTADLVIHYDENIEGAKKALQKVTDKDLSGNFSLKTNGQVHFTSPKKENVASTLNHWVHHRGQLTVYLRMTDRTVPAIYGPSADDQRFA